MKSLLLAGCGALLLAAPASAQETGGRKDLRIRAGIGPQLQPSYPGASDYDVAPLFDFVTATGDEQFQVEAPDDRFGFDLFTIGRLTVGPAASIQGSRRNSEVGAPVGKVDTTVEVGGFVEYVMSDSFRLRAEAVRGVNGHNGLVGSVGVDKIWRDGDRYSITLGPRLMFSNNRYQRAYFGVTPTVATATGLRAYRPDGGIHAVALTSGMFTMLNDRWGLFGYARAERLIGDAEDSPIVRTYGDRSQFAGGLGLSYVFRVKRR